MPTTTPPPGTLSGFKDPAQAADGDRPRLGLATTRELTNELHARMNTGGHHPEYRTIEGGSAEYDGPRVRNATDAQLVDELAEADGPAQAVSRLLGVLAGAASMCWDYPERAGVFDSTRAKTLVEEALSWLMDDALPELVDEQRRADREKEAHAAAMEPVRHTRFDAELVPTKMDVVVNRLKMGHVYQTSSPDRWASSVSRASESLGDAVERLVRYHAPAGHDKVVSDDIRVRQTAFELHLPQPSAAGDELDDEVEY